MSADNRSTHTDALVTGNPVDKLIPAIADAANTWMQQQQQSLAGDIHKRLDKARDEILMKILGFDKDSWDGRWKVDHCNGRDGNSIAGDFLKQAQHEAVQQWLANLPLPVMTPKLKAVLEKDVQASYERACKDLVYQVAKRQAEKDMAALAESITPSQQIGNFLKLREMISTQVATPQTN